MASKTTTSNNASASTILSKKPLSKKIKQSAQITIPKRNPTTLSPFISTNFRLKQRKKYPLLFTNWRTSLTTRPTTHHTTSSTPFTTSTMKIVPNTKISTVSTQHTSNTPMHNTLTTLTTPTHTTLTTITNTTIPTTTINSTNPSLPSRPSMPPPPPPPPPLPPYKHKSHPLWTLTFLSTPDSTHPQCH